MSRSYVNEPVHYYLDQGEVRVESSGTVVRGDVRMIGGEVGGRKEWMGCVSQ